MAITVTDVNDSASIVIDENQVRAVYELELYRMIIMATDIVHDVTESMAVIIALLPPNGGNV